MSTIRTNSQEATGYAKKISAKAAALIGETELPKGGETNLKASKNCEKSYTKKSSMLKSYTKIAAADGTNIAKIHASMRQVDEQIKNRLMRRR